MKPAIIKVKQENGKLIYKKVNKILCEIERVERGQYKGLFCLYTPVTSSGGLSSYNDTLEDAKKRAEKYIISHYSIFGGCEIVY